MTDPAAGSAEPGAEERAEAAATPSLAEVRERLVAHRAALVGKVEDLGAHDPAVTAQLGFGKRIGDGTLYAVERMTGAYQARTLYETVKEIDLALARVDADTYGLCVACGAPIPAARLEALPEAALCVPCSGTPRRRPG